MTRNTEETTSTANLPTTQTAVFVAAKDPKVHFGDAKPAFAGCGAVIAEYADPAFHGHLMEMLAEEDPELLESITSIPDEGISAGVLIRARKELERTKRVARNLDTDNATRDARFRELATLSLRLKAHAVDLKQVLPDIIHRSNCRHLEVRQSGQLVLECWRLINEIMSASSSYGISIPHPLAREAESLRMILERAVPKLHACRHFEHGSRALYASIDSLTVFDVDEPEFCNEQYLGVIQSAEAFITRIAAELGDGTDLISRNDRELLASLEQRIARHKAAVTAVREDPAFDPFAPETPVPSARGPEPDQAQARQATAPEAGSKVPPTALEEEMPREEGEWTKRFSLGEGLVIDPPAGTVTLNGKSVALDNTQQGFMLLMILAKNKNRWVPASRLAESDGPWHDKGAPKAGTLRGAVFRLCAALAPLPELGMALKSKNHRMQGSARLTWPPPAKPD